MEPTYIFEGDQVYAMREGKVVASGVDVDELESKLASCKCGHASCDGDCSGSCANCKKSKEAKATHIITPNGIKGKILGHVEDVFGEGEVTVRLENGRIAHLKVADAEYIAPEDPEYVNPIAQLEERLDEETPGTKPELQARQEELKAIHNEASSLIQKGASAPDSARLDQIAVTADHEAAEIKEAIDHLDSEEAEAFEPPAPFDMHVVEQGGRGGGEWLDATLNDMVQEAESYDYEKLMDEGPEAFVAEQDDGLLADQGATQAVAASFIREKTAAADPSIREKYEATWLARVENVRREELTNRKETTKKEAATQKETHDNAPDESLFL